MLEIITNNKPRNFTYGYELSEAEKADFDYIDDIDAHDFIRYKGRVLDPSEFVATDPNGEFAEWTGSHSETFYSGLLIKYTDDHQQVIMGSYYS